MSKKKILVKKSVGWRQHESVYFLKSQRNSLSIKIAGFDLDGTLIKTKSGNVFPKTPEDWQFAFPNVVENLTRLHREGYRLVIISNQKESKRRAKLADLKIKFQNIIKAIDVPVDAYFMTADDHYRKPMTDVWDLIMCGSKCALESFYCGDGAGRPAINGRKKDHHITDRYFAKNIGIDFYTPEELFVHNLKLSEQYIDPYSTDTKLNLPQMCSNTPFTMPINLVKTPKLVIITGAQASGKSTLAEIFTNMGFVYLSNDQIKNKSKLNQLFIQALNDRQSIVIDNTNPKRETRAIYIHPARDRGYCVYSYYFNLPKAFVQHLNNMRTQMNHGKVKHMSKWAYYRYYKDLEPPSMDEGFTQIYEITKLHKTKALSKYYWYSYDLKLR